MTTVKSFVKKNHGNMFIKVRSSFDGMTDGCEYASNPQFEPVEHQERMINNTLGINGAWFVRGGGDLVRPYEDDEFVGFDIYNCCGSFFIAIKKAA